VEWAAIEYSHAFAWLVVSPTTSRSTPVNADRRRLDCIARKPSIAVGEPAIVPARFGMKPMFCSSPANCSCEACGADCLVWIV
jgi:hypothetical protein